MGAPVPEKRFFEQHPEGCCINCGYLTASKIQYMDPKEERRFPEIIEYVRQTASAHFWMEPFCFVNAADPPLAREVEQLAQVTKDDATYAVQRGEAVEMVLTRDRQCQAATLWRPGYTPREHRDMMDRRWMLEREDRRDEQQQAFYKGLHRQQLLILGGGVIAATLIAGVIGAGAAIWGGKTDVTVNYPTATMPALQSTPDTATSPPQPTS